MMRCGCGGCVAELQAKRESVVAQLKSLNQQVQTLLQFLAQAELVKNLRAEKQFTAQYLADNFNVRLLCRPCHPRDRI